jgi:hypothetical protein
VKFTEAMQNELATFRKGPRCSIAVICETLDADDREALTAALASDVPHSFITRALAAIDHRVAITTVGRHRRGDCDCDRG